MWFRFSFYLLVSTNFLWCSSRVPPYPSFSHSTSACNREMMGRSRIWNGGCSGVGWGVAGERAQPLAIRNWNRRDWKQRETEADRGDWCFCLYCWCPHRWWLSSARAGIKLNRRRQAYAALRFDLKSLITFEEKLATVELVCFCCTGSLLTEKRSKGKTSRFPTFFWTGRMARPVPYPLSVAVVIHRLQAIQACAPLLIIPPWTMAADHNGFTISRRQWVGGCAHCTSNITCSCMVLFNLNYFHTFLCNRYASSCLCRLIKAGRGVHNIHSTITVGS